MIASTRNHPTTLPVEVAPRPGRSPRAPSGLAALALLALATALPTGCSPAPSAVAASPPPAAPPVASASEAATERAEPEGPGLGPSVPLASPAPSALRPSSAQARPYRRGLIGLAGFGERERCPEAEGLPASCSLAFASPFAGAAGEGAGWAKQPRPGAAGPWQVIAGVNGDGRAFAGRDAVLVVSPGARAIEAIDEHGARSFRVAEGAGLLAIEHVVETSDGLALLALTGTRLRGQEVEVLAVYPLELSDGRARLGAPAVLPFAPARSIAEGRFLRSAGLRSAIAFAPSLGVAASGELAPTFSLAWLEATVPTRKPPPGPPPGGEAGEGEDARSLGDASIEKRLHVARVDRKGTIRGERVTAVKGDLSALPPLPDDPRPGGPSVPEGPPSRLERDLALGPPTVMGRPVQWPRRLSFDATSGRGEAVFLEGGQALAVPFDALGRVLGPPSPAPEGTARETPGGRPGAPPGLDAVAAPPAGCHMGVETGPGLAVLLCDEPSGPRPPGRLGLRALRYGRAAARPGR